MASPAYGPSTKVNTGVVVSFEGMEAVQKMLAAVDQVAAKKVLQQATSAGGKAMKPFVVAAAPAGRGGKKKWPGSIKGAVWVHRAARNRPATVVGHHKKKAWYWHIVVGGARPHRVRFPSQVAAGVQRSNLKGGVEGGGNIRHPGAHPNPFVARGAAAGESAAMAAVNAVIEKYLAGL